MEALLQPENSEKFARRVLGISVVTYIVLALWLARGASFTLEEFLYIVEADGFAPDSIVDPFGGHLTAVTRLFYETSLRLFGPSHLPFQVFVTVLAAAAAVLMFVLVKRRVGPLAALAPALVFLFLGSTPEVLNGWVTMWVQASAAGLGAFVALDQRSRRGDALACILLIAAVLSFSVGVAFAIGAAAWILAERGGRRIWVAALPLAIYGAWWLWALKFDEGFATASNLLLAPTWAADSLAAAAAALAGLSVDLTGGPDLNSIAIGWGRVLAAVAIMVAVLGVRRRGATPMLWGAIGLLLALWIAGTLSYSGVTFFTRTPDLSRYAYPVGIGLALALAAALQGSTPSRRTLLVILGLVAFALPVNLWQMGERGTALRAESDLARARLAVIELERELVPPEFVDWSGQVALAARRAGPAPGEGSVGALGIVTAPAGLYFAAFDRFGSFGYSLDELGAASPGTRRAADETLGSVVSPQLSAVNERNLECDGVGGEVELPPGGGVVRSETGGTVSLRRFSDAPVIEAGTLAPGEAGRIQLPIDAASQPWIGSVGGLGKLETCSGTPR